MSQLHELADSLDKAGSLDAQLSALEAIDSFVRDRRLAVYDASLAAPESEKILDDESVAWMRKEEASPAFFPVEVKAVAQHGNALNKGHRTPGMMVAVRPCDSGKKTFLGVLLGDAATSFSLRYHRELGLLHVHFAMMNPAIWVPDLDRIVYGYESWWGPIKDENHLHQITDEDIGNVWYVRALQQLTKRPTDAPAPDCGDVHVDPPATEPAPQTEAATEPAPAPRIDVSERTTPGGSVILFAGQDPDHPEIKPARIELRSNGDILVNGRLVETDAQVVDGLRAWLISAGCVDRGLMVDTIVAVLDTSIGVRNRTLAERVANALLQMMTPSPRDRCDQCGALRAPWQDMLDNRCPNHAIPEPYSSCDGKLVPQQLVGSATEPSHG